MLIDFHSHAWLDKLAAGAVRSLAEKAHIPAFTDGTLADTRRVLHGQGVDTFVLLNIAVAPRTERHVNDFAISLVHEADIIPFGSVHPDSENALAELARLHAAGVKGVKFHNEYQNFFVDDEKAFPLYERCAELGLVMLFHGGKDLGFGPPVKTSPARMRRVAEKFKGAKIVVAHLGGQRMEEEAIGELASTTVYIDTSYASRCASPELGEKVIRAFGADRVLFGTDCPWDTPASMLAWLDKMALSPEEREKIYSGNARRLLGAINIQGAKI